MEISNNRIAVIQYKSQTRFEIIAVQYSVLNGWENELAKQGFALKFCTVLYDHAISVFMDKYRIQTFSRL